MLIAGVAGLALGAGIGVVAAPDRSSRPDPVLVRALDTPFTFDRRVQHRPHQSVAVGARHPQSPAASGRAWITLSAQTRNIDRENFLPRSFGYRLRTATGS